MVCRCHNAEPRPGGSPQSSMSWNINQLKYILKALKRKEGSVMPTRKTDLIVKYKQWKGRTIHRGRGGALAGEVAVIAVPREENEALTADGDCINAMMTPCHGILIN